MADLFDGVPASAPMFDLLSYAQDLYAANNSNDDYEVKIFERTLGNNQDYDEMAKEKFHWTTASPSDYTYPADERNYVIAL